MTVTTTPKDGPRATSRKIFWRRLRRSLGSTFAGALVGGMLGYGACDGTLAAFKALPKCGFMAAGAAIFGGWIPIGVYYEGHRLRWSYIVVFYLGLLGLTFLLGYSLAAGNLSS